MSVVKILSWTRPEVNSLLLMHEFSMHHKDLANKFRLALSSKLDQAFESNSLSPDLIKELLIYMEFCHLILIILENNDEISYTR